MANFTAPLIVLLDRSVDRIRDIIAKDGLTILQSTLREFGFEDSEYLKDYKLYAHVSGDEVIYEIALSVGAIEEETDLSEKVTKARNSSMDSLDNKFEEASVRSFGLSKDGGVVRMPGMRDKRKSNHNARIVRDKRRSSNDVRMTSKTREFGHKAAQAAPRSRGAPRSMDVDKSGKLKLTFTRQLKKTKSEFKYPEKDFEGIMKKFVERIQDAVAKRFIPELEKTLSRYYK